MKRYAFLAICLFLLSGFLFLYYNYTSKAQNYKIADSSFKNGICQVEVGTLKLKRQMTLTVKRTDWDYGVVYLTNQKEGFRGSFSFEREDMSKALFVAEKGTYDYTLSLNRLIWKEVDGEMIVVKSIPVESRKGSVEVMPCK